MMDKLEGMSEEEAMAMMGQEQSGGGLGPNPFDNMPSGLGSGGGMPNLGGGLPDFGAAPVRGDTKKNRKKKKR